MQSIVRIAVSAFVKRTRPPGRVARFVSSLGPLGLTIVLATTFVAAAPAPARADEVKLDSGDVIRGEVTGGTEKELKLKHAHGDLVIPYDKITSVTTDKAVEVKLIDGSRLKGKLGPGSRPRSATVQTEAAGPITGLDLDKIAAVNEPPDEALWTGRLAAGMTLQDGNTRSRSFFGSFDTERLTKRDRIEFHALYTYNETYDKSQRDYVLSARKSYGRVQYSFYFHRPWYIYAGGGLEYDYFQNLRLRSRAGAGIGYAFLEEKDLLLRVEGGVEYVNEDYRKGAEDRDFVALRGAIQYEQQLTEWLRVGEFFEIVPNTERFRDFYSRSITSATVSIVKGFGFAAILIWEHDQIPATDDLNKNDATYILTITYVF